MAEALGATELRELIRHIMEDGFNRADMAVVHASFHPDYRRHGFGGPSVGSLDEHVSDLQARHDAFDGARFEIHEIVADAERQTLAVRYTFHGVHTAEFLGVAPTGRAVTRPSAAFFQVRDGKVAEGWIVSDGGGFLAQLRGEA